MGRSLPAIPAIPALCRGAALLVITACGVVTGLDGYNVINDDGGAATTADGGAVVPSDAAPPITCKPNDGRCIPPPSPPLGFTRIVFVEDGLSPCPPGHDAVSTIEGPVADASACSCGACTATIDCSKGTVTSAYDNGAGNCAQNGLNINVPGGACTNMTLTLADNAKFNAPSPNPGPCTSPGVANRDNVKTPTRRICVLSPSACPEHACPTLAPSTQRSCLLAEGDVACPSSTDTKRVVGADITVTCGKCPCQVSATCTGFIEVFENVGCPAPGLANVVLHADAGVCTPSIAGEYGSYRWNGSIATQNCSVQPPKTPMLETQQKKTICCPP